VEILRAVAQALAVAHERGIVHRDVKPGNILLADGSAVVSDFGIAKAIVSAWAGSSDGIRTGTGVGVGTAKYAAPEQAMGDATTDHRADIYSFGVVAYELLAGVPPFEGDTPVQLVTAHLTETPRPLEELRPELPGALAELVMQCLEKSPDRRPASARALVDAIALLPLSEPTPPGAARAGRSPQRRRVLGIAAALGAVAIAAAVVANLGALASPEGFGVSRDGQLPRVVVGDPSTAEADTILGIAFAAIVRSELAQSSQVSPVSPTTVATTLARMRQPPTARVSAPIAREIGQRIGAAGYVDASIARLAGSTHLTLRLVTADSAREVIALSETVADESELSRAMTRLARALRRGLGESRARLRDLPPVGGATTSSLEALALATAGVRANVVEDDQPKARRLLEEAVRIDPEFASAWRALAAVYNNLGLRGPGFAERAGRRAMELSAGLPLRERTEIEAFYYFGVVRDPERAEAAYQRLVEITDTTEGEANLAEMMLQRHRPNEARALVTAALRHRDTSELLLRHLFQAEVERGSLAAADTVLRLMQRHVPNTNRPFLSMLALAHQRGEHERVRQIIDSVEALDRPVERAAVARARLTQALVEGAPRRALEARRRMRVVDPGTPSAQAVAHIVDTLQTSWVEVFVVGDTASARDRLLRLMPWLRAGGSAPDNWPLLQTLYVLTDVALIDDARRVRELWEQTIADTALQRRFQRARNFAVVNLERVAAPTAETIIKLRSPDFYPAQAALRAYDIATAFDRMGRADSAAHYYGAYLRTPTVARFDPTADGLLYTRALERLTELEESLGHDSLAVAYGARLLALWRYSEPRLAARVRAVEERLVRLERRSPDAARARILRTPEE